MELELLNSDEILEVRSNLGIHQAYVQSHFVTLLESHVPSYGSFIIYRVILIDNDDAFLFTNAQDANNIKSGEEPVSTQIGGNLNSANGNVVKHNSSAVQGLIHKVMAPHFKGTQDSGRLEREKMQSGIYQGQNQDGGPSSSNGSDDDID